MNKKQLLAHTVFLLLQETETSRSTGLTTIAEEMRAKPKEVLQIIKRALYEQSTMAATAFKQPALGTLRLEHRRWLPDIIHFTDGTSVWVRTVAKKVFNLLVAEAEADQYHGAC